jgi:hypothetical protein
LRGLSVLSCLLHKTFSTNCIAVFLLLLLLPARYWTLAEATPQHFQPAANPLPSDLSLRPDLKAVARGDMAAAQRHKEEGEHQQRADRRLREAAGVYEH